MRTNPLVLAGNNVVKTPAPASPMRSGSRGYCSSFSVVSTMTSDLAPVHVQSYQLGLSGGQDTRASTRSELVAAAEFEPSTSRL